METVFILVAGIALLASAHAELSCAKEQEDESYSYRYQTKTSGTSMIQSETVRKNCVCLNGNSTAGKHRSLHPGGFGCPNSKAIQMLNADGLLEVKELNIETGEYSLLFSFQGVNGNEGITANGGAINHLDSYAYCVLQVGESSSKADSKKKKKKKKKTKLVQVAESSAKAGMDVLARFDSNGIQLLGTLPEGKYYAGSVSQSGDYYIFSNDGKIVVVPDPSQLQWTSNDYDQLGEVDVATYVVAGKCADVVMVDDDIGRGRQTYLVGIQSDVSGVILYEVASQQEWNLKADNLPADSWGSGWTFSGGAYFAANSGIGVYQIGLRSVDLEAGTVNVRKVGSSDPVQGNDGMNCANGHTPFPGCEYFCIDHGCKCIRPASERCLLNSCAQCPFCF
jgi:hypothetical protein